MSYTFFLILIPIYFISAFSIQLSAKPHSQVILQNTIPKEHLQAPEIKALVKKFSQRIYGLAFLFSFITLPIIFIPYASVAMTYFWMLLFGSMSSLYLSQLTAIRQMHHLVIEKEWTLPVQPVLIDTSLILQKNRKIVSIWWFLPPLLLLIVSSYYQLQANLEDTWLLIAINIGLFLLSLGSWWAIYRLPVRPVTTDATINQQYNDLAKHDWSLLMLSLSWIILPIAIVPTLSLSVSNQVGLILTVIMMLLVFLWCFFIIWYLLRLRKKQDQLLAQSSSYRYLGEDQFWRYGMYINPHDYRLFVPNRTGMKLGVNLGRPIGKVIAGLTTLLVLVALFMSTIPLYLYDFTSNPFELTQTEQTIEIKAPFTKTATIDRHEITSIELIDELAGPVSKINGLAIDNYDVGHFTVHGHSARLYIDKRSQPILHIMTNKQNYYYTNNNPEETQKIYQSLTK